MKLMTRLWCYCLVFFMVSCSSNNEEERTAIINSLIAALDPSCITTTNYQDHQGDVYAYRVDHLFNSVSIQAGGHSSGNETPDLGFNLFGTDPLFGLPNTSTYTVDSGSNIPGSSYVFYYDGTGAEYISTDNNMGVLLNLDLLTIAPDGSVTELKASFNQVEVMNTIDHNDKLCVNAFQLVVNNN